MKEFEKYFDHTNLKPDAVSSDIKKLCLEAKEYGFKSVCVNQIYTSYAKELLKDSGVGVCVVAGFPLGAQDGRLKAEEAKLAIENGADEIDMVINIGALKDHKDDLVEQEISMVKAACKKHILKVIIEACLLTDEEKVRACKLAVKAGADFVKTSTGFSKSGATVEDVRLMKEAVEGRAQVKAAGGIRDYETAIAMINAGADRLGTSATLKITGHA